MFSPRKHGHGWEGAAPKSDAGRGVRLGCPRNGAAFESFFFFFFFFFFFSPTRFDSRQLGFNLRRIGLIRPKSDRIGPIGSYRPATETAEAG